MPALLAPVVILGAAFTPWDWAVLAGYFALLVVAGILASRGAKKTTDEYFLAGRHMPVWAVAVSILATAQSAATFTGVPEQAYNGDLTYLSTNIGGIIAGVVLATLVIPRYYRLGVSTPYQLLETRYGPGAKLATSWAYMIGRVFASGARVYVGALPVSMAVFGDIEPEHLLVAVAAFMAFGIVYTLAGGLTSVIWTDVVQVCVYLGATVVAVIVLFNKIDAPIGEIWNALSTGGPGGSSKLTLVKIGIDPSRPNLGFEPAAQFTLVTALTGFVLITLASHGTDQDLVQRMLTCRSGAKGGRSVILGILIGIPVVALFLLVGLLLWVFYQRPDLTGRATPDYLAGDSAKIFLNFILHEMPAGAAGLMIAGVLAAGPAGINASLNSMASTFVGDVYRPARPGLGDRHYVLVGRWAVVTWGVILGGFAMLCIAWRENSELDIINFVLSVMSFAYAGLLGVFLTALFTRRGSTRSAVAALVAGFLTVLAMQPAIWDLWTPLVSWTSYTPFDSTEYSLANVHFSWPWQLVIGTAVAMAVCLLGSRRGAASAGDTRARGTEPS